jgi:hypothetical protein
LNEDDEISHREWFLRHYLRYWYWVGCIFLAMLIIGSMRALLPYPESLYAAAGIILPALLPEYLIYRRIWPPG